MEFCGPTRLTDMEYTSSPKPQLSSRANAFSIAALMSSGKPSKDKEPEENTIKPLGKNRPATLQTHLTEVHSGERWHKIIATVWTGTGGFQCQYNK